MLKAKEHIQRKCELLEEAVERDPQYVDYSRDYATSQFEIGKIVLSDNGQFGEVVAHFDAGLDRLMAVSELDPNNNRTKLDLVAAYQSYGDLFANSKKFDVALDYYKKIERICQGLELQGLESEQVLLAGLVAQQSLANNFTSLGRTKDAIPHYKEMLRIGEKRATADPSNAQKQLQLANVYRQLARKLTNSLEPAEIKHFFRRALEIRKKQLVKTPNDIQILSWVADSSKDVGDFLWCEGLNDEGMVYLESALGIVEEPQ